MKKRSLIYSIIVIALFEKVIFWLGVFTAQNPTEQLGGIWKITFVFTLAAGYLAYWVFSRSDAPAKDAGRQQEPLAGRQQERAGVRSAAHEALTQPRLSARPTHRPGLTPAIIHPAQRSSGD